MARISRKTSRNAESSMIAVNDVKQTFKTAVYARLSVEDKDNMSLDNQILLVKNYIEKQSDLSLCGVFSDNGLTGTNFKRPGFERLMDDIRGGRVNCVVVKDLSRFGRNYMETGNFLEVIFPHLGVRFISIGDNYDSFDPRCQSEKMIIGLKNMINAHYSKDISMKIKSAFAIKRKNGEYTGAVPPFGYQKSPEDKNKLIIDEAAAEIVRMIFKLKIDGMNVYEIAQYLSKQKISNPCYYFYVKGIYTDEKYKDLQAWDRSTVKGILENTKYLEPV